MLYFAQFLTAFLFIMIVMIGNVNSTNQSPQNRERVNIFYFSDYHGNMHAYRHLKTASDRFDKNHEDTDNLKLSGGDLVADVDPRKRTVVYRLLKQMKIDASAVGNHEWDRNYDFYDKFTKRFREAPIVLFNNFLSCNVVSKNYNPNDKTGLFHSKIITKNGKKYGLIGATTPDYKFKGTEVHDFDQIKRDISAEVAKLKEKDPSLDRIILLSHLGMHHDQQLAQSVSDVDVIIGGHSHTLVKGIKEGKNLFLSPKGEPVLIVQAGNERGFGELSLVFDEKGKIDFSPGNKPINKTDEIKYYRESPDVEFLENYVFGKPKPIGILSRPIHPHNHMTEENPLANLATDALKNTTGAEAAILNAGTFRSVLKLGELDERDIEYCMPFDNKVVTVWLSGQEIANIIRTGVESLGKKETEPGLMQVSGLKYTVTPDYKLKNLYTVDESGSKKRAIVDSSGNLTQEAYKGFNVAMTDFMVREYAEKGFIRHDFIDRNRPEYKQKGKLEVDRNKITGSYDFQRNMLIDYLETEFTAKGKNIDVDEGRITFEKSPYDAKTRLDSLKERFNRKW